MLVLIADDEPLVLAVLVEFITDLGHDVQPATDGQAAIEILRREPCDLLVTDIRMPRMNGAELLGLVGVECPALLVVVITGWASDAKRLAIERSGARVLGTLQKPFEFAQLQAFVDRAAAMVRAA